MKYTVRHINLEAYNVVDEYEAIVYEELEEFEARTVVEIINSSDEGNTTWDAVSSDWRWAVLLQIRRLTERLDQLTSPTSSI